jgi:hypothetical protein
MMANLLMRSARSMGLAYAGSRLIACCLSLIAYRQKVRGN